MAAATESGKRRRVHQEEIVKVKPVPSTESWDSVISDPQFPKFHRCKRTCLFLIDNNHLIKVGYQEELENIIDTGLIPNPSYVPIPGFIPGCAYGVFLGSCNGLMCFQTTDRTMLVWNPCTGKIRNLPKLSVRGFNCCWFGYDNSGDDYKLIVSVGSEVHVLTLKSNSWRKLITKDVNFGRARIFEAAARGTLLAGNIHWLAPNESCIAAFELSTEKFQKLSTPDLENRSKIFRTTIGGLGGCLYLFFYFCDSHYGSLIDLWIMKDYGMISSWTKLSRVRNYVSDFRFDFTPLYYAKEDEIVALMDSRMSGKAWIGRLNITNHSLSKILVATDLSISSHANQSVVHMESLVSVDAEEHG